jgi:predicted nucleic acid-binding protein
VVAEDPDDDAIVDCAVEARASYIVSGDTHLTSLGSVAGIEVVTPTQFLDITEPQRR